MPKKSEEYLKGYREGYMDCFAEAVDMILTNAKSAREFFEITEKRFEGDTRVDLKTIREEMS